MLLVQFPLVIQYELLVLGHVVQDDGRHEGCHRVSMVKGKTLLFTPTVYTVVEWIDQGNARRRGLLLQWRLGVG